MAEIEFDCGNCGAAVFYQHPMRHNHCPFCFWSMHLNHGNNASSCRAMMKPESVDLGQCIVHSCTGCGATSRAGDWPNETAVTPLTRGRRRA
jgi:hypothetical protein